MARSKLKGRDTLDVIYIQVFDRGKADPPLSISSASMSMARSSSTGMLRLVPTVSSLNG
jgi:hypothetical protein